jgi:hypothetical protein
MLICHAYIFVDKTTRTFLHHMVCIQHRLVDQQLV